jgi:hypothetical protein
MIAPARGGSDSKLGLTRWCGLGSYRVGIYPKDA